jgi:Transglycosylase SLT domain/SPOR domain
MKSAILAVIFSFCLLLAGAANAQLAGPEGVRERDSWPAGPLPTLRSGKEEPRGDDTVRETTSSPSICQLVASAAAANGLPFEFFARVIWQESRFRSDAVGPITRGGQRAQGIAQFMPMTAEERLLRDPFDPVEALPKSGEFLRDLREQFGNLGLAAAAYNAGPQRVRDWLAGKRTLPLETQTYVRIVTGRPVQEWARPEQEALTVTIPPEMTCTEAAELVAKPRSHPTVAQPKPTPAWVVQLVGDRSETKALIIYRQLQKKHEALLGIYQPVIVRTSLRVGAAPIWTRVRVAADSRQAAETLCSKLRAAGEECLPQRN